MTKHLTLAEVAQLLRVDRRTVYRWVAGEGVSRPLPAYRVGGVRRVDPRALKAWMLDETTGRAA